MQQLAQNRARSTIGRALASVAAIVPLAGTFFQPEIAQAAPHGGGGGFHDGGGFHGGGFGGFHGGGFHGSGFHGGGFHGVGFHGGAFHAGGFGGFHGGGFHGGWHGGFASVHNGFGHANGGHWDHGWHNGRYGWWWGADGLGWTYYPYYPDYGYYDYNQPYASQSWYYCSDPAGYYPYVTQCNTTWQTVPAS